MALRAIKNFFGVKQGHSQPHGCRFSFQKIRDGLLNNKVDQLWSQDGEEQARWSDNVIGGMSELIANRNFSGSLKLELKKQGDNESNLRSEIKVFEYQRLVLATNH